MKFIDETGETILDVPEDVETLWFPHMHGGRRCVNVRTGLRSLKRLKILHWPLTWKEAPDALDVLRDLSHLEELGISTLTGQSLAPIATCSRLKILRLVELDRNDVEPLSSLTNLEELLLDGTTTHLDAIGSLTKLQNLSVMFNKRVPLRWFANLENLEKVCFLGSRLMDLEYFRAFRRVSLVDLQNTNTDSLAHLTHNKAIETLWLGRCRKLESLDGIEHLTALTRLDIDELRSIPSIRPLSGLKRLRRLLLNDTRVEDGDLSPLTELPALEEVILMDYYGEHLTEIARRMPHCNVRVVGTRKAGEPSEIHGNVGILKDIDRRAESIYYRIDQDLTALLNVETNDQAEERVQTAMRRHSTETKDLEFDSEGEAFVVRSASLDAIRSVAQCINELAQKKRKRRD